MTKRYICLMIGIAMLLSPFLCFAETVDDLKKEVDELKSRVEVLSAAQEDTADKISNIVKITGYADLDYSMTDKAGEDNEFRLHKFSLILKKEWTREWNFFTEVEYEDAPFYEITTTTSGGNTVFKSDSKQDGKIFNEIFYLEYKPTLQLGFRLGRFLTSAGIWNQEPYAPFVPTDKKPEHIRKIFPQVSDGLSLHDHLSMKYSMGLDYFVYAANGSGEPGKGDSNENKAIGGRLALKIPILDEFVMGASFYTDDGKNAEKRESIGADIKLQINELTFWGEYATAEFDPAAGSYDKEGYYGQLMYDIDKWTVLYRYDYYESEDTVNPKEQIKTNTVGLNYHVTPEIVAKLEHHCIDPKVSDNYMQTILSMAVYFGE